MKTKRLRSLVLEVSLVVLCVLALLPAGSGSVSRVEPAGAYDVSGVNRAGSTYEGRLVIDRMDREALYHLEWDTGGEKPFTGSGALVGRTLYVVWAEKGTRCFVVYFDLADDGTLDGLWISADDRDPAVGTETAVPMAAAVPAGLAGEYRVTGSQREGTTYERRLTVTPLDDHYRFTWEGDERYEGVGVLEDGQVHVVVSAVGGGGACGKAVIQVEDGGRLEGTWMINDESFRQLGSESAIRRDQARLARR